MENIGKEQIELTSRDEQEKLALTDAVLQSTVGITGVDEHGHPEGIRGTGTLIMIGSRRGVLTAEHLIEGSDPRRLRFMAPDPDPHSRLGPIRPVVSVNVLDVYLEKQMDTAFIELADPVGDERFTSFRSLPERDPVLPDSWKATMVGYPAAAAKQLSSLPINVAVRRWESLPLLAPDAIEPSRMYDPEMHFLLSYEPGESLRPEGYSGSGLWGWDDPNGPVWLAKPVYIGMAVAYSHSKRTGGVLIATKLSVIRRFLDSVL